MASQELKSDLVAVGGVVSAAYGFFVMKGGLIKFLSDVSGPAAKLTGMNFEQLKLDVKSLTDEDRLDCEAALKASLPAAWQPSVDSGEALVERCVALGERLVGCYSEGLAIVADFKALFSI